ncbi:MAG: cobalamin-binding protein [Trueperaceae bacterium]|nr:cobalamin-binding protein [Trueperaceae bacterium]
MRVVSLACSNTEIVCALGCEDLLVGVDDHSDRPVEVVADLPRLGPDLEIDIAAVCDLEPDLVLASLTVPGHEKVIEDLEEAGLEYLVFEPLSLKDILSSIREIAAALEVKEKGERLIRDMRACFQEGQYFSKTPKVLVQWWNHPSIVPARYSWVTEMIALAGGINPLKDTGKKSTSLEDKDVALINPDVIILSWCGVDVRKYRPEVIYANQRWQEVKAVKQHQVFSIPEAYLGRPGPGLMQGFIALKEIIRQVAKN